MNKEKQKIIADICPFYREYGSCDRCNTAFDIDDPPCYFECMANAIIDNNYRKVEWISVEERLPEDGETVLTIDSDGEMQVSFYETDLEGIFQQCHGLVMIYNITHWMPLPKAPKGGE